MGTSPEEEVTTLATARGAKWYLASVGSRRNITEEEVAEHFDGGFIDAVGLAEVTGWITRMAAQLEVAEPLTVDDGRLRVPLRPFGSVPRWRVLLTFNDDGRIAMFNFGNLEVEGVQLDRLSVADAGTAVREAAHTLFDANYANAGHAYLDDSLTKLDVMAIGRSTEEATAGNIVGVALGGYRVVDLPRSLEQDVKLSGLVCVDPSFRRRGLASRLVSSPSRAA